MAVSFTQGNDFIVPTEDGQTYLGGAGNDTYMLSDATIAANSTIVIQDTEGTNTIQLVGGLSITSSQVTSNALELTLSNGAKVQILGADSFGYDVGGNALAGVDGTDQTFTELVEDTLGTTVPAAGDPASEGGAVEVETPAPPLGDSELSIDDVSVTEGDSGTVTASFTVTLGSAPAAGESVTVDYATADVTADAGDDYVAASGTLTFAEGETTKTIDVTVNGDTDIEDSETFAVNLSNATGSIDGTAVTIADSQGIGTIVTDDVAVPGEDFELTVGADVVVGTAGDDTLDGTIEQNQISGDNEDTFTSIDIIDGGAGNDTLTAQVTEGTNGATVANVENINLTAFVAHTFSMGNVTGLKEFANVGSIQDLTLDAIGEVFDLTVKNVNAKFTKATFDADVFDGTTDEFDITLSNASNNAIINLLSSSSVAIETINIESTGSANKVTFTDNTAGADDVINGTKTLNIAGDQKLTMTAVGMDNLVTVDASKSTGGVSADLSASAAKDQTITGGSGNDKITTEIITKDDVIDLKDGTDTLVLTDQTDMTTAASLANIENLFVAVGGNVTFNAEKATELEKILVGEGTHTITYNKLAASANTVVFDTMDGTTNAATYDSIVYNLKDATGTDDVLNVVVQNTDVNENHVSIAKDTEVEIASLTANKVETINLVASDLGQNDDSTTYDSGLLITAFAADKIKTLNIEADGLVDVVAANQGTLQTIDASGAAGGVRFQDLSTGFDSGTTTHADTKLTITGGDGADVLTGINADVATTVISLGAGKDSITLNGSDFGDGATTVVDTISIDAGAGDDTIDVSASTTLAAEGTIEIALGDGVDKLVVAGSAVAGTLIQTGITVTDFTVGAGGDKIDFNAVGSLTIGGTLTTTSYAEVANGTDYTADTIGGLTVYTANDLTALTPGALATAAAAVAAGGTGQKLVHNIGDDYFVVASDGTDTGIFLVNDGVDADGAGGGESADTVVDAAEVVLLVTLAGVSDASKFTVDNFTDFLA